MSSSTPVETSLDERSTDKIQQSDAAMAKEKTSSDESAVEVTPRKIHGLFVS